MPAPCCVQSAGVRAVCRALTCSPLPPQAILAAEELPLAYHQTPWAAQELGPFLRQCLLDQHFPAFVEDVEKELRKLLGPSK